MSWASTSLSLTNTEEPSHWCTMRTSIFIMPVLQTDLCSAPAAAFHVVANLVAGLHAEPLWQGSVGTLQLTKLALDREGLDGAHICCEWSNVFVTQVFTSLE